MSRLYTLWDFVCKYKHSVIIIFSVIIIGIADDNSMFNRRLRVERIDALNMEIADYNRRFQIATDMLVGLDSDPRKLEQVAREKYYMKRAGEDVYVIRVDEPESIDGTDSLVEDSVAQ